MGGLLVCVGHSTTVFQEELGAFPLPVLYDSTPEQKHNIPTLHCKLSWAGTKQFFLLELHSRSSQTSWMCSLT